MPPHGMITQIDISTRTVKHSPTTNGITVKVEDVSVTHYMEKLIVQRECVHMVTMYLMHVTTY